LVYAEILQGVINDNKVLSKLISEFEMSNLFFKNINNRNDEKSLRNMDNDSILEMVAKGFQIERALIQAMFEAGRISRETAKEMRGNITALESQLK
jgi:hypothetical protein